VLRGTPQCCDGDPFAGMDTWFEESCQFLKVGPLEIFFCFQMEELVPISKTEKKKIPNRNLFSTTGVGNLGRAGKLVQMV